MPRPWPDPRDRKPVRRAEIWLAATLVVGGAILALTGWLAHG